MKLSKRIAVGIGSFVLAAGIGIAAATVMAEAPISGSVHSSAFTPHWDPFSAHATGDGMTCSATNAGDTAPLNVQVTQAYIGGTCHVTGDVGLSAPEGGIVTGVELAGLPAGWTVTLDPTTCGMALAASSGLKSAGFTLTMGPTATVGQTASFTGGLQVSPASAAPKTLACATP